MCEPVSIGMAVVAVAGSVMGAHDKAKAEGQAEDAKRKSQMEMVKQMNIANADLNLQAQDKGDQARQQLTEVNLKSLRNRGMLNAAIGESGLSGNSMDRIKQVSQAQTDREAQSIRDNYKRDYQAIFANQVGNVENTKSQLKSMAPTFKSSRVADALNAASAGMGAYMASGGTFGMGSKSAPVTEVDPEKLSANKKPSGN